MKQDQKGAIEVGLLMKIAGGAIAILTTIALANAKAVSEDISKLQDNDASQDTRIEVTTQTSRQSACVNNSNFRNLAIALKASWVPDPACDVPR